MPDEQVSHHMAKGSPVSEPVAEFQVSDLVRIVDSSRFHDMIGVVIGTRQMSPAGKPNDPPTLHVDVTVHCEHSVAHRCTVPVDKCRATGGTL